MRVVLQQKKPVFLYLDGTSGVIRRPYDNGKQVNVYSLILPSYEDRPPFLAAEGTLSNQAVPDLLYFLERINYYLKKLSHNKHNIDKLETDFSLALLQAASLALNNKKLISFIQFIYKRHNDPNFKDKYKYQYTTLHICSSHLQKTVLRKGKELFSSKELYRIAGRGIATLIHCGTLHEACEVFGLLIEIFGIKNNDYTKINLPENLNDEFQDKDLDDKEGGIFGEETEEAIHADRKSSPYYEAFSNVLDMKMNDAGEEFNMDKENDDIEILNIYYCPAFIAYLREYIMPYFPLWSAVEIKKFKILRDSNATIENLQKQTKLYIFKGEHDIPVNKYIQEQETFLQARLLEREFSSKTYKQRRNRCADSDDLNPEDIWKKKQ